MHKFFKKKFLTLFGALLLAVAAAAATCLIGWLALREPDPPGLFALAVADSVFADTYGY